MTSEKKGVKWRIGYAVFCLIYAGWVIYLGLGNFDKVYGEYREAVRRNQPDQIHKIALQELVNQCRAKLKRRDHSWSTSEISLEPAENACSSFPDTVQEQQRKVVAERLHVEKKRFLRKLIVFYISFGVFFLALPIYLLYLLLSFLIWIFKDLKFVK